MARQFLTSDSSAWGDRFGSGSDGALTISSNTTDSTANTTFTGTSGTTSGTAGSGTGFAANNLVLIHQTQGTGAGNWELNKISSTGSGTNWTMAYTLQNTYGTGAQVYLLKQYSSVTVNGSTTLTSSSWNGSQGGILGLLCNGTITVTGTIKGDSTGFRGGAAVSNGTGNQGEGINGTGSQDFHLSGNAAGGGQHFAAGQNGGGGGGGNSTGGSNGQAQGSGNGGQGGNPAGAASLTTMVFGGAGGSGGADSGSTSGVGGNGGGIVLLIGKTVTITGGITTAGQNASNSGASGTQYGGSGGGAGGSILVKGQTITLGTTLLTALAGNAANTVNSNGGAGDTGRIHADYSASISGTTNPTLDSTKDGIFADSGGGAVFALL